jgi:LuxR family maltose regulon positive regulatory protein
MNQVHICEHNELLSTKFHTPVCPTPLIPRPRLTALLDVGVNGPLTLVSAPAGFGKTTLLSSWVQSHASGNFFVAWVTLDEHDNQPWRFWEYVLTAFDKSEPGIGVQALQRLSAPGELFLEEALIALINRLAQATSPWVLILDEYQAIREPIIHDQLSYLVEHLPSHVHVLLATRKDPPLPLSRWRVRGQLLEVRTDQLSATVEETGSLLRQMAPIRLERSLLQEVNARTEGWLAALRLVGLSLQAHADLAGVLDELCGSQRYILDYVTEEVLRQQDPAVSTFLLRTSILSQLTAPLCDAVLERTDSRQVLEELERTNIFVVPLGPRRCYRYHALFAEVLRTRLEQENGEDVLTLHWRASNWYAQHGHTAEAVHHALLAHAWQQAADLIESISQAHAGLIHEESMILSWIMQLPAEILCARPQLCQFFAGGMTRTDGCLANERWQQTCKTPGPYGDAINRVPTGAHETPAGLLSPAVGTRLIASHALQGKGDLVGSDSMAGTSCSGNKTLASNQQTPLQQDIHRQAQRPLSRMHALAPFTEGQCVISNDQNQQHLQEPMPAQDRVRAMFPSHERPFERQHWSWRQSEPGLLLLDPLSAREREVIVLVAQGYSNQEIAEALVVEVNTVKRHVGNIFSKLQVHGRIQAVIQARALGLLTEVA